MSVLMKGNSPIGIVENPIKTKTVSGTTTANGNLDLGLTTDVVVLSVVKPNSGNSAVPYVYLSNWYATICDSSGTSFNALPNTNVTVTVYYIEL